MRMSILLNVTTTLTLTLIAGEADEDEHLVVMAHARSCTRRCPLGKHCDAAKQKHAQLVEHNTRCKFLLKDCERCTLLDKSGITEEEAMLRLEKNANDKFNDLGSGDDEGQI